MSQFEPNRYSIDEGIALQGLSTALPLSEASEAISLSIVSNSRLLREGLFVLLARCLNLKIVGAYSGKVCLDVVLTNPQGHIVLIDSGLGRAETILWTRYWHTMTPSARVLILEMTDEFSLILECIEAGATGYTLQGASVDEVSEAVNAITAGLAYLPPRLAAQLFARLNALGTTPASVAPPPVTLRELEVLQHIAMGCSNMEIAERLSVALPTVKQHVHHILRKLNARSRADAARLAAEQGWLTPHYLSIAQQAIDPSYADGTRHEMHTQIHLSASER